MKSVLSYVKTKLGTRRSQGIVEYGLIIGIMVLIVVAALTILRQPLIDLCINILQ